MRKSPTTIPTLIGMLGLVGGLISGLVLVQSRQIISSRAAINNSPQNVRITNVTDNAIAISWITEGATTGHVMWKKDGGLPRIARGDIAEPSFVHYVRLSELEENSKYTFTISSGGDTHDNNGLPWKIATGPKLPNTKVAQVISGRVLDTSGLLLENALVYVTIPGGTAQSTLSTTDGTWVVPISVARTTDLTNYVNTNNIVDVAIQSGTGEVAFARATISGANPLPDMKIGNNYDYTKIYKKTNNPNPGANLELPDRNTDKSVTNP